MCASNLQNLYLHEELIESVPEVLLTTLLSLMLSHERPLSQPPVYYAMLLNSIIQSSKDSDNLKKLKVMAEEKIAKMFGAFESFNSI